MSNLSVFRLMANTEAIMTGMIFFQLLCAVVVLALILFALNVGEFPIFSSLNVLSIISIICYVYCYISEQVTERAFDIGDIVYGAPWYQMQSKYQKSMGLIIVRCQKKFRMTGFSLVECSLEKLLTVRFFGQSSNNCLDFGFIQFLLNVFS